MDTHPTLRFDAAVDVLKAFAEPTRLRLLMLLSRCDLTVSELTTILGQSQPRISRHLKLLAECRILERYQEGAFAFYRVSSQAVAGRFAAAVEAWVDRDDPALKRDEERLGEVRADRARRAADYFACNAASWDRIRALHVPDREVEAALDEALGRRRIGTLLDIGTGTGRMLELLAPRCERALGIDASREMLAIARAKLDDAGIQNAQVRQGDAYHLPVETGRFDLVVLHQVLHYLDDPQRAVREAASVLSPGGRLVIVDFAQHEMEFLRAEHAHLRLGFSDGALAGYFEACGLDMRLVRHLRSGAAETGGLTVTICVGQDQRVLVAPSGELSLA